MLEEGIHLNGYIAPRSSAFFASLKNKSTAPDLTGQITMVARLRAVHSSETESSAVVAIATTAIYLLCYMTYHLFVLRTHLP